MMHEIERVFTKVVEENIPEIMIDETTTSFIDEKTRKRRENIELQLNTFDMSTMLWFIK